jgi:diguanylate cyclase (GGDEF)-like protein
MGERDATATHSVDHEIDVRAALARHGLRQTAIALPGGVIGAWLVPSFFADAVAPHVTTWQITTILTNVVAMIACALLSRQQQPNTWLGRAATLPAFLCGLTIPLWFSLPSTSPSAALMLGCALTLVFLYSTVTAWDLPGVGVLLLIAGLVNSKIPVMQAFPWWYTGAATIAVMFGLAGMVVTYNRLLRSSIEMSHRNRTLVHELRRANIELEAATLSDPLTGVGNRRAFEKRLNQGGCVALVLVDLDHFKNINDSWGHPQGDRVLVELAEVLRSCVRPTDVVCRVGGDEFAVLISECTEEELVRVSDRIQAGLFTVATQPTVSIGATLGTVGQVVDGDHASTIEALLQRADQALYEAKAAGRNSVRIAPRIVVAT